MPNDNFLELRSTFFLDILKSIIVIDIAFDLRISHGVILCSSCINKNNSVAVGPLGNGNLEEDNRQGAGSEEKAGQ